MGKLAGSYGRYAERLSLGPSAGGAGQGGVGASHPENPWRRAFRQLLLAQERMDSLQLTSGPNQDGDRVYSGR